MGFILATTLPRFHITNVAILKLNPPKRVENKTLSITYTKSMCVYFTNKKITLKRGGTKLHTYQIEVSEMRKMKHYYKPLHLTN